MKENRINNQKKSLISTLSWKLTIGYLVTTTIILPMATAIIFKKLIPSQHLAVTILVTDLIGLALGLLLYRRSGRVSEDVFKGGPATRKAGSVNVVTALLLAGITTNLMIGISTYLPKMGIDSDSIIRESTGTQGVSVLSVLAFVIVAPLFEEVAFRGIFYRRLRHQASFVVSAALSSIMWALFHGDLKVGLVAFGSGIVFCLIYEVYRDLRITTAFHVLNNFSALFGPYLYWQLTGESITMVQGQRMSPVVLLSECLIVVYLFYKVYTGRDRSSRFK